MNNQFTFFTLICHIFQTRFQNNNVSLLIEISCIVNQIMDDELCFMTNMFTCISLHLPNALAGTIKQEDRCN